MRKTRPAICTHSETMLPTTWSHLLSAFIDANRNAQPIPVMTMNIRSECRCRKSSNAERFFPLTGRLSGDPTSYKNFVPRMMTTEPLQSAVALPKNAAQMSFWIEHPVPDDPNDEEPDRNQTQRMTVKKRRTTSGHVELLVFSYFLRVNHHAAGFAISQNTSFHCSRVHAGLSLHDHISPRAKWRAGIQTVK